VSVFKRGKSTPMLGAFHSSDIPEFFGFGVNPDFIGTDALGMFFRPLYVLLTYHGVTTIQSILPILVIPLFHTTLTVSSPLWIGNHGVHQLTIRC
jgi:hypothetical protein